MLVDCTSSDTRIETDLRYLKKRFPDADAWQISAAGWKDYQSPEGIRVGPAILFHRTLV